MNSAAGLTIEGEICARYGIPQLQLSPLERMRSLLAYRNDRRLFRRQCDQTGEPLISAYPPGCGYTVVKSSIWWGDDWDGVTYGFDADPTQPFFPQFARLQRAVPREGTTVVNSDNCEYNSHVRDSKDCYLCSLAIRSEGLLYCYWTVQSRDILDGFYTSESELCACCRYITQCYRCVELHESSNCSECYFSSELQGCSNCLFCVNLSNASYRIRNRPCTPEEFRSAVGDLLNRDPLTYKQALAEMSEIRRAAPARAQHSIRCEEVLGDHLYNSRSAYHCFDLRDGERCYNNANGGGYSVAHGYSVGFPLSNHVFSSLTIRSSEEIFFCTNCWSSNSLWYCDGCVHCRDCFGCAGLKHRQYCIFNRQLDADSYRERLADWRAKMLARGEWGVFFPAQYSPYAYNESAAQDFFPLAPDEISARGWKVAPLREAVADELRGAAVPAGVKRCDQCARSFRVVPAEVRLALELGVPQSSSCPECRLNLRLAARAPYQLVERRCGKCAAPVATALTEEAAPKLWCEPCFIAARG